MAAGASALLVVIGGGMAGATGLTGGDGRDETAEQTLANDPGAAHLEQDPEIVSREAAAAAPPPKRRVRVPVRPAPPVAADPARTAVETGAELRRARAEDPADRTGPRPSHTSPRTRIAAKGEQNRRGQRSRPGRPARPDRQGRKSGAAEPVVTTRTDVETRPIPYQTKVVRDDSLPRGYRKVQAPGMAGEEMTRYLVTLVDGRQAARRELDTTVVRQPQQRVVVFGVRKDCAGSGELCVPLGRTACPEPDQDAEPDERPGAGPLVVTGEDLSLLDPELPADIRLEPATAC
ncbi:G5 domain-containing protein [Actinoplanes siamensis]|uniref:G5 domain-containing protein n=1 Tax=Actinoplanes siamensis TaxID=1223317 RepID=A0A919TKS4_9ACTN|nr:G5 domain-containing protein [Actinoplanes siamensis]GIF06351.1 hypothetical protein Asi03nite_38890 [Actinoplanes siamensis]